MNDPHPCPQNVPQRLSGRLSRGSHAKSASNAVRGPPDHLSATQAAPCQKTKFSIIISVDRRSTNMVKEKDTSEDEEGFPIECQRCGRCCGMVEQLVQGDPTMRDVAVWIGEKRWDILEWVGPFIIPDSEDAMFDIWVNPKTHDFADRCPWLRKDKGSDLHECAIYDVRPAACREWPSSIADGQKIGCPACQEELSDTVGKGGKVSKPHRDDD